MIEVAEYVTVCNGSVDDLERGTTITAVATIASVYTAGHARGFTMGTGEVRYLIEVVMRTSELSLSQTITISSRKYLLTNKPQYMR